MWGIWQALGWIPDLNKPARILLGVWHRFWSIEGCALFSRSLHLVRTLCTLTCQWLSYHHTWRPVPEGKQHRENRAKKKNKLTRGAKRAHDIHGLALCHTYSLESLGLSRIGAFLSICFCFFTLLELVSVDLQTKVTVFLNPLPPYSGRALSFWFRSNNNHQLREVLFGHPSETSLLMHFLYK